MNYLNLRVLHMQYDLAKEYEKKVPKSAALLHKGYMLGLQKAIDIVEDEESNYPRILGRGCDFDESLLQISVPDIIDEVINRKFK